jgi:hypothetical protein
MPLFLDRFGAISIFCRILTYQILSVRMPHIYITTGHGNGQRVKKMEVEKEMAGWQLSLPSATIITFHDLPECSLKLFPRYGLAHIKKG